MSIIVDVIIPTWNSARTLGQTLESVETEIHPSRTIIIDRDSEDGTIEIARSHGCVVLRDLVSLGSARMKGIRESNTEWIVFIDDDIRVASNFLVRMERFIDDDTGAICSPCISVVEPHRSVFLADFEHKFDKKDSFTLNPMDRGHTNATLVRRNLILDLDISDMNAWEDWAITQRVIESGKKWLVVKVYSDHNHRAADLWEKDSWNSAGILNLGRTGRIKPYHAVVDYIGLLGRHIFLAFEETIERRDSSLFQYHIRSVIAVLWGIRHFLRIKARK